MRRLIILRAIAGALSIALLGSCGGGGGGGSGLPGLPNRFVYVSALHVSSAGQVAGGGIYAYQLDSASGTMMMVAGSPFATETYGAPLVMSRDGKFLYVSYSSPGEATGSLVGYRIQTDGSLVSVPGSPYVTTEPVSTVANPAADFLYTVSSSARLNVYAIDQSTGALSVQPMAPYPLPFVGLPLITPNGRYAYLLAQGILANPQEVYEFSIDIASGALTALPGSPVTLNFDNQFFPAGGSIDPSGKFIYIANSSPPLTGFGGPAYGLGIDQQSGAVNIVWSGNPTAGPQNSVAVDASGKYVLMSTVPTSKTSSQNCFAVLTIDPMSGALQQVSGSPFPGSVSNGSCGALWSDPSAPYVYEVSGVGIYVYSLDPMTGGPTEVTAAVVPEDSVTALAVTH